jgi:hypothetical protein
MKNGQKKPAESNGPQAGMEDTEAILNRRKFLIQAALTGAGMGAVIAGCKAEEEEKPKICLQVLAPTNPPATNLPSSQPQECLKISNPQICLKIAPPQPGTK